MPHLVPVLVIKIFMEWIKNWNNQFKKKNHNNAGWNSPAWNHFLILQNHFYQWLIYTNDDA